MKLINWLKWQTPPKKNKAMERGFCKPSSVKKMNVSMLDWGLDLLSVWSGHLIGFDLL
jgi:hypothetical protein